MVSGGYTEDTLVQQTTAEYLERELWVRGDLYRRRADIVGFVNGLPLLFMELKNVSRDIHARIGPEIKRRQVKLALDRLCEKGSVRPEGEKRGRRYWPG